MMKNLKRPFLTLLLAFSFLPAGPAAAQGFGFGDEAESGAAPAAAAPGFSVKAGGELVVGGLAFLDDLADSSPGAPENATSARLTLTAAGSSAEAVLKLRATEAALEADTPAAFLDAAVEEAYLRAFLGPVTVETGLIKVVWGKADSQGPLDVLNPHDLTDLSVLDTLDRKIAQPMLRAVVALGPLSKLDAVFLPSFEGNSIALTGRWAPAQAALIALVPPLDTNTLDYAQGGLRFTTTTGSVDWGLQYFCGFLPMPALHLVLLAPGPPPIIIADDIGYNRYHQIGADAAAVLAGFNLRAELGANLTEDTKGDDPAVYNSAIVFSLGADRDIAAGINLNLQYAGSIRLRDGEIVSPFDIEKDSDAFSSTLTAVASQKLFRDKLEWMFTALWEPDDKDCYLVPSVSWTEGDAEVQLAAGFFAGDEAGQLGQYRDSSYLKLTLSYKL